MDTIHTRKNVPKWKQGWTDPTASISTPPLPLVAIFGIVIFLLSLSQYSSYKEHMHTTVASFKLLLLLAPVFLLLFLRSSLLSGIGFSLRLPPQHWRGLRHDVARGMAGFPWGVVILVVVLLVLVSYKSSFQST